PEHVEHRADDGGSDAEPAEHVDVRALLVLRPVVLAHLAEAAGTGPLGGVQDERDDEHHRRSDDGGIRILRERHVLSSSSAAARSATSDLPTASPPSKLMVFDPPRSIIPALGLPGSWSGLQRGHCLTGSSRNRPPIGG